MQSLQILILVLAFVFYPLSQALALTRTFDGAIYTLFNNPDGASIIAMSISNNGSISSAVRTSTGGRGLSGITGPGQPAVGSLFGSDAVTVGDNVRELNLRRYWHAALPNHLANYCIEPFSVSLYH